MEKNPIPSQPEQIVKYFHVQMGTTVLVEAGGSNKSRLIGQLIAEAAYDSMLQHLGVECR